MDIKHVKFEYGKKHLFLDISSTNINTLVSLLYQCVETSSIQAFWLLSQSVPQLRCKLIIINESNITTSYVLSTLKSTINSKWIVRNFKVMSARFEVAKICN
jgi:hypothetical protein